MAKVEGVGDEDAKRFSGWILERGGIAVWEVQLIGGGPGGATRYYTPAKTAEGEDAPKPHWSVAGPPPAVVVTDPADVIVFWSKEVRRFRVGIRPGGGGFKCTDAASRKIRKAVDEARKKTGKKSWYEFDYFTQEAVIFVTETEMTLAEWEAKRSSCTAPEMTEEVGSKEKGGCREES